jgi:hypothetical protein
MNAQYRKLGSLLAGAPRYPRRGVKLAVQNSSSIDLGIAS